uniref:hypothetical protein n=1 Tax=Rickettsia endosymbiont of Urophora cardui TaxID=3066265 RepID=UPI00313BF01F
MTRSKCSKDLYKSFLQASSVRYTSKALSEVSPLDLSHDSASRWLKSKDFRPSEIYSKVSKYIANTEMFLPQIRKNLGIDQ